MSFVVGNRFLQCGFELWEIIVAGQTTESVFCFEERGGHPPVALKRVMPALYVANVVFDISHEALDAIGGLEAPAQLVEEPEPMERQGLLQALLERTSGLAVDLLQFGVEIGEPLPGGLVGGLLIGPLEPGSPGFLVVLR